MAAESDASESVTDAGGEDAVEDANVLTIAMRALKNLKTATEMQSVRAHKRAVGKLCLLKTRLEASDDLSKDVAQVLVSAGAMINRAVTFATNDDDASDLSITLSLIFGLLCSARRARPRAAKKSSMV